MRCVGLFKFYLSTYCFEGSFDRFSFVLRYSLLDRAGSVVYQFLGILQTYT